jgi:hypothetical protein
MWCCVGPDFVNLAESPAGFGQTMEMAYENLSDFTVIVEGPEYEDNELKNREYIQMLGMIASLNAELNSRPKCVVHVDQRTVGTESFILGQPHDVVRCRNMYSRVTIEMAGYCYEFASPVFTRTPKERMQVDVLEFATGEIKIMPRLHTWSRTEYESPIGSAACHPDDQKLKP